MVQFSSAAREQAPRLLPEADGARPDLVERPLLALDQRGDRGRRDLLRGAGGTHVPLGSCAASAPSAAGGPVPYATVPRRKKPVRFSATASSISGMPSPSVTSTGSDAAEPAC